MSNTEALAANNVFDGSDPVQVENLRARLERELFTMAREIAMCGLVPTIMLKPATSQMGEYEIEVDVRYGRIFYRDPKFYEFISARIQAEKAMSERKA